MSFLRLFPNICRKRARLHREDGAALVEFAFSFAIFTAVSVGILILCMALFTYEYVDFASREAVRWAIVRGGDCYNSSGNMPGCTTLAGASGTDIENYVKNLNYPLVDPNKLVVTATWWQLQRGIDANGNAYAYWISCGTGNVCNNPGNEVQVTVSYPFSMGIPFFGSFSPYVSSSSQMVISQ